MIITIKHFLAPFFSNQVIPHLNLISYQVYYDKLDDLSYNFTYLLSPCALSLCLYNALWLWQFYVRLLSHLDYFYGIWQKNCHILFSFIFIFLKFLLLFPAFYLLHISWYAIPWHYEYPQLPVVLLHQKVQIVHQLM